MEVTPGRVRETGRCNWFLTPSKLVRVYQGEIRNTFHLISLLTVPDISQSLFGDILEENEVDLTRKADTSRLEALVVGKACYVRQAIFLLQV